MNRIIAKFLTCGRLRLRRLLYFLIGGTIFSLIVLSWWNYFSANEENFIEHLRSVQSDYSYYYHIDVEALKRDLPIYNSVKESGREPFEDHYFNKILSDDLPLDRSIPDSRDPQCLTQKYKYRIGGDENVSVIIGYHNEALSTLLRTIISVLNRTPPDLLKEIILIDDFSEIDFQKILISLPRVRYLRNNLRLGLIKSRNIGTLQAQAKFLVFLDSHCEVNMGWLEPLFDRLIMNNGLLVSPIVDIIDSSSFSYKPSSIKLKAGFDWSLRFKWIPRAEQEIEQQIDKTTPFQSPMTYGGIFMVTRDWFNTLDNFEDALEIWGGETVELSIKSWLCGGQIEIVPCSRIGHVFRKKHPYTFGDGSVSQTMLKNSRLVAENWLDEYKKFYYAERPLAKDVQMEINVNKTNLLKDRLQCRSFSWYLQVVFRELKIPNQHNLAYGELKSNNRCLQISMVGRLELTDCYIDDHVTTWSLQNNTGLLTATSGGCLTAYADYERVGLEFCRTEQENVGQQWKRSGGNLINLKTKRCLDSLAVQSIGMSHCKHGATSQLWQFSMEIEQRY